MCTNKKWIYNKGYRKETTYNGKQGEAYEIALNARCGDCEECIAEKANNWVVRNFYESKKHDRKCFITLTYDKEHNPYLLNRRDVQKFFKRLRFYINKEEPKTKIRYFYCGEYGTLHKRPHYHAIIYGWDDKNAKYLNVSKRANICFTSEIINKAWGMGITSYQDFDEKEVPYIALYNTNKERIKNGLIVSRKALKKAFEKTLKPLHSAKDDRRYKELLEDVEKNDKQYKAVKEFNGWSQALGWEAYEEEYDKTRGEKLTHEHQIQDKNFKTPSTWLKKLANKWGEQSAIDELERRKEIAELDINKPPKSKEKEIIQRMTERLTAEKRTKQKDILDEI